MIKNKKGLSSKEVRVKLKIRSCDLMHLREHGILRADKNGNAYIYNSEDVESYSIKLARDDSAK